MKMKFVGTSLRRAQRLHYACLNALAPHFRLRWLTTLSLLLAYLCTTTHPCSDIITYLLAFYLLLVAVNYFTPRGLEEDEEEE